MRRTHPHATPHRVPTSARPTSRAFVFVWRRMAPSPWEQTLWTRRSRHADDHQDFAPPISAISTSSARYTRGVSRPIFRTRSLS